MLFSESGERWLRQLPFDESDRIVIDGHLRLLEAIGQELARVEKCLAQKSYPSEDVRLLITLPGVGPACAQALCAALGDWRRFRDGDHAVIVPVWIGFLNDIFYDRSHIAGPGELY